MTHHQYFSEESIDIEGKPLTIAESSGSYHHQYFSFLNDEGQHNISYFAHHQYFTDGQPVHSYCLGDESGNTFESNYGPTPGTLSPPPLYPYHPYYIYDGYNSSSSSGYLNTLPANYNDDGSGLGIGDGLCSFGTVPDSGCNFNVSGSSSSFDDIEGNPLTIAESSGEQPIHPYCLGDESGNTFESNYGPTSNTLSPPPLYPYHPYYIYDGYNSSSSSSGYLNTSGTGNLSCGTLNSCSIGGGCGYMNNNDFIEIKPSTDLPLTDTFTSSGSSLSSGICSQTLSSSSTNLNTQMKPLPTTTATTMPTSTTTTTPAPTTTKNRRKKKEPADYVLLDVNSAGDEKTEFIKYVGKGSYKCQICDIYSKNNKDYIQDHINIKHYNIKKNYECLLCNITFAWRSGAFKHLKKYHSIEGKNTINFFRAISRRHVYHSQRKRK